ncbi:hypothetical protein OHB26_38245 [Nocardia sp. NBC_01503]|uniref:hypothetical protein n=1 Tax=Nocardia sp. NBC_01503 TaxID=2975997 RepID=UPI002E7B4927|nr:hypothetical protein [Nocardia sp. NBC_01503]WTL32621.1 hypothetical protein OHB26_38245 [Nocardia sp. NBC_01503]
MTGEQPALLISQVEKWNPGALGTDATNLATVVTEGRSLLQSMLTEQDDLAESWNGPGASSAATRVAKENTAGTHIVDKIDSIDQLYTTYEPQLSNAKDNVLNTRTNIKNMGFDVYDDGNVNAETMRNSLISTAKKNGNNDGVPGYVAAAILQLDYAAAEQRPIMKAALQTANNVAVAAKTALDLAKSQLTRLVLTEASSKAIRMLFPGLVDPETAQPSELPPDFTPVGAMFSLQNGIPVTTTLADGSTETITPNPDGTVTVSTTAKQPDGSTITTSTTNGGPSTTTVSTPRTDGSGITDVKVTGPDGKTQRLQTTSTGEGRSITQAVNEDGSLGRVVSETYPQNGGVVTDLYGENGVIDRQWQRPDGFRAFEQYVQGADGQPQLVGTSNSAGMQSVLNTDGSISTTYPDGQTAHTAQLADGRVVTRFQDGSILEYDPSQAKSGAPHESAWDVVKSWSGSQWNTMVDSTRSGLEQHTVGNQIGTAATATSVWASSAGSSMAEQAAKSVENSMAAQTRALSMLDSGIPGAGKAFVGAMDSATDASARFALADTLKADAKLAGWPALIGTNAYMNYEDWANHTKSGQAAIANTVGATIGGWAGAEAGAYVGGLACAPLGPIGAAFCAGVGAAAGGLALGSYAGTIAEKPFN